MAWVPSRTPRVAVMGMALRFIAAATLVLATSHIGASGDVLDINFADLADAVQVE